MSDWSLGAVEGRFADLIWTHQPVTSTQLVKLAEGELKWKKSTTYTVLRRLCERGIFQNQGGMVTALISREDFYAARSQEFVEDAFDGSLPAFLTAFTRRKRLSEAEIREVEALIDQLRG